MDEKSLKNLYSNFVDRIPMFQALADEERLRIIFLLMVSGEKGVNVKTIAESSHLSRPAVSHHLKTLKDSGFIAFHKVGTQIFYKPNSEKGFSEIQKLMALLQKVLDEAPELLGSAQAEKILEDK